jgi:hypothetical protein
VQCLVLNDFSSIFIMKKSILGMSKLLEISGSATKKACICSEAKDTGNSVRTNHGAMLILPIAWFVYIPM